MGSSRDHLLSDGESEPEDVATGAVLDCLENSEVASFGKLNVPVHLRIIEFENGRRISLARIRDVALENPERVENLHNAGKLLDWLELPENDPSRVDRAPDWEEYAESSRHRLSLAQANANRLVREIVRRTKLDEGPIDRSTAQRTVIRVLGACSRCLRRFVNRGDVSLFRDSECNFRIGSPTGNLLQDMFLNDPVNVMTPNPSFVNHIVCLIAERFADGESIVPGFDVVDTTSNVVRLRWQQLSQGRLPPV